jgi:hypothetical protein
MSFRVTAPVENRSRSLPTTLAAEAHIIIIIITIITAKGEGRTSSHRIS